ncbi:14003_t:CDS:2 [Funneliformis geosporum]|nr:14003_t:CDS:2 [Funneliformis geosporum]
MLSTIFKAIRNNNKHLQTDAISISLRSLATLSYASSKFSEFSNSTNNDQYSTSIWKEENDKEMTTLGWSACINCWIEMVNDELYEDEINIENQSINKNIYPAEDLKAKWVLFDLFTTGFKALSFVMNLDSIEI